MQWKIAPNNIILKNVKNLNEKNLKVNTEEKTSYSGNYEADILFRNHDKCDSQIISDDICSPFCLLFILLRQLLRSPYDVCSQW